MLNLTFGEQVKIILSRKGMTIKELAERIEEQTGKKMSRQNLTQRLGRDNFQEQDMRMIAEILECPFYLNILDDSDSVEKNVKNSSKKNVDNILEEELQAESAEECELEEDIPEESYIEEVYETVQVEDSEEEDSITLEEILEAETPVEELLQEMEAIERENNERGREKGNHVEQKAPEKKVHGWKAYLQRRKKKDIVELKPEEPEAEASEELAAEEMHPQEVKTEEPTEEVENEAMETSYVEESAEEALEQEESSDDFEEIQEPLGDINPYTNREYETNSVRMHPTRIGYVQVYDRSKHQWSDMTEWAFLGYQEQKKALLGDDYEPPIYLD